MPCLNKEYDSRGQNMAAMQFNAVDLNISVSITYDLPSFW